MSIITRPATDEYRRGWEQTFGRRDGMTLETSARILGEALGDQPPAQPPLTKYGPPIYHTIELTDTEDT